MNHGLMYTIRRSGLLLVAVLTTFPALSSALDRDPVVIDDPAQAEQTGNAVLVEGPAWTGALWSVEGLRDPANFGMKLRSSVRDESTGAWTAEEDVPIVAAYPWMETETPSTVVAGDVWYAVAAVEFLGESFPRDLGYRIAFTKRTPPGGWMDPQVLISGDVADSDAMYPRIAADSSGHVYVVYEDNIDAPEHGNHLKTDVFFVSSADEGDTWTAPLVLNTHGVGETRSCDAQVACDSAGNVYAVWAENIGGRMDVLFRASPDFGASWSAVERVPMADAAASSASGAEVVATASGCVVAWSDMRNGCTVVGGKVLPGPSDVYARTYTPGPTKGTWSAEVRLDTDPAGAAHSSRVRLAADGSGRVIAVWQDNRTGVWTPRSNASSDGGASWLASDVRADSAPDGVSCGTPSLAMGEGGLACVGWSDCRDDQDIARVNYSLDGGSTWQGADVRADADASSESSWNPGVAAATGGRIDVAWTNILLDPDTGMGTDYVARATYLDTDAECMPFAEGWHLMSVPLLPNSLDPRFTYANLPAAGCAVAGRVYGFDPQSGYATWDDLAALDPALGYWYLSPGGGGGQVCVSGSYRVGDCSVELSAGWHVIGVNFPDAVAWGDCVVTDGVETYAMSDPAAAALLGPAAYRYDGNGYAELDPTDPTAALEPWYGYWVVSHADGVMLTVLEP